jgi:acyl dehydratase
VADERTPRATRPDATVLDHAPALGPLYARALLTAPGRGGELTEREVTQRGARIDRDRLAAYDRVCGFGVRDELPATYLHVLAFPLQMVLMVDRSFPFALPGLVHVRNRIVQHRPVRADEVLDLRATARNLRPHAKGAQVDLVGEARVGDELVWEGVSTYLAKGAEAPGQALSGHDELEVSLPDDASPAAVWRVPKDMGRRYAGVSGDVNPMHLNPLAAKASGFPRMLVHGMWTKARALAALEPRLPEAYAVDVAFSRPLLLPATVGFVASTAGGPDEWDFAVRPAKGGREHLRGRVVSATVSGPPPALP